MKKLAAILLLSFFLLPACEKKKPDIELPLPTEPPNIERMQPSGEPLAP